jgi:hypothetical protein
MDWGCHTLISPLTYVDALHSTFKQKHYLWQSINVHPVPPHFLFDWTLDIKAVKNIWGCVPSSSKEHKESTVSGRHTGTSCPLLPTSILRGLPHAKQPPGSGWKAALTESTSLLIGVFTEQGDPGAASLNGGSSLLWVSLGSQRSDQGMEFLLCVTDGDAPCPQVSCPRDSFRSQDLAWWNPCKTLSLICTVWILLNWPSRPAERLETHLSEVKHKGIANT